MHGYTMITSDGSKVGHVVGELGENFVVESGHLRKTKHLVPKVFATIKDEEELVCVTVTKDVIEDAPSFNGDDPDEQAVLQHYGLAGGFADPDTEGYGDTVRDDPAFGDQATAGAERERVGLREREAHTDEMKGVRGRSSPNALQPAETPPTDDGLR